MIYLISLLLIIIFTFLIFKINLKEAKMVSENKELSKVISKFPDNIEIGKEMLKKINNEDVKIEQANGTDSSVYIAITNKISIADTKNNYARIQTIAHECLHSVQDKTLLITNFVISNINILYFLIASVLTITKVIHNQEIFIFIAFALGFLQFVIRSFLEIDAMTKSEFLTKEYIEEKNLCTEEEKGKILEEYKKINKIGIPFTVFTVITNILTKIIIYSIICIIF